MSSTLYDLHNRIITDTGSTVAKYDLLLHLLRSGKPIEDIPCEKHDDVIKYHISNGSAKKAKVWQDDGKMIGPPVESFHWNIPDDYKNIELQNLFESLPDTYQDRLDAELDYIATHDMTLFFQALIYIRDVMLENDIVWGLGRGSSCASLVLYLLGINLVDPMKYDIPMGEFYK